MNPRMIAVAALLMAVPALAQTPPPPGAPAPHAMGEMRGKPGAHMGHRMFPSMSEAGRAIVREAMMAGDDRSASRQKMAAVRDKMMTVLAADRLDLAAVKRVMEEERALADASRTAKQAAMLAAVQKLSTEDRKAFVADSRAMKERMGKRMANWRERWQQRGHHGKRGDMPTPPPPPPRPDDAE
jgi:Spy/CpxP family protein refolding chaperone